MILMQARSITGAIGTRWALKIETFLGPEMTTGLGFETKYGAMVQTLREKLKSQKSKLVLQYMAVLWSMAKPLCVMFGHATKYLSGSQS